MFSNPSNNIMSISLISIDHMNSINSIRHRNNPLNYMSGSLEGPRAGPQSGAPDPAHVSPRISGLRMTEPICRRACWPAFCTLTWESVSTSVSLGTMLGRQEDSCLGAQKAMAPSSSTEPGGGGGEEEGEA